jgi:retron-type reverse transcriptase
MLDLSAAFDCVSHDILLNRLHYRFGFDGQFFDWIESYLCNHTQEGTVNGEFSSEIVIEHGVPQGSILHSLLFIFFTSPNGEICRKYGIKFNIYADDGFMHG